MNPYSKISIVVFTYNEESRIEDFLRYYGKFPNIYLSDGSSNDSTIKFAKKINPDIKIIKSKKTNYADRDRIAEALAIIKTEWVFLTVISERLSIPLMDYIVLKINKNDYPYKAIKFYRQSITGSIKTHSNSLTFRRPFLHFYKASAPVFKKSIFDYDHSRIHHEFTLSTTWNHVDIIKPDNFYYMSHFRNPSPIINLQKHINYAAIEAQEKISDGFHFSYLRAIFRPMFYFFIYLLRDFRTLLNPLAFITIVNHAFYIFLVEYFLFYFEKNSHEKK